MRFQKAVLALAATLALAAPAAAFAQDFGFTSRDGHGYGQSRDRGGEDRYDGGRSERYGERRFERRPICRMGVFYMRGTWCATRGRGVHDRWDRRLPWVRE